MIVGRTARTAARMVSGCVKSLPPHLARNARDEDTRHTGFESRSHSSASASRVPAASLTARIGASVSGQSMPICGSFHRRVHSWAGA